MSATELSGSVFAEAEEPSPEGQPRPACKKEGPMKAYEEGVACGALRQVRQSQTMFCGRASLDMGGACKSGERCSDPLFVPAAEGVVANQWN